MYILVVDDDHNIRNAVALSIVAAGHKVETAANGNEALELIQYHKFDAVLLDVEMPTMSGWKVLEAIKGMSTDAHLPVVLFTAHENPSSDAYAKMLGASALLRKPVFAHTVLNVINRAIEERLR